MTCRDPVVGYGSRMRIPKIVGAVGVSLVLALLAACGGATSPPASAGVPPGDVSQTSGDAVLLSLQQSAATKTAAVDVTADVSGIPVLGRQHVTGTGVVDLDAQKAQAHFDALGIGIDAVVDGNTGYVRSTPLGGNTWYRLDANTANTQGTGLQSIWTSVVDPTQLFSTIRSASDSMTEVGHEQLAGVDTTHYSGTIDLRQRAQAAGATTEQIDALASAGLASIPVDVWVDSQGLIARIRTSVTTARTGNSGAAIAANVTVDFHDYGKPVEISTPAAQDVKGLDLGAFGALGNLFGLAGQNP